MQNSFEDELEQLVSKFSRELAQEVTALILGRLGIEPSRAGEASGRSSGSNKGRGGAGRAAAKSTPRAARPGKRNRMTVAQKAVAMAEVAALIGSSSGLAVGEIEKRSGLTRNELSTCLKALKEQGRVFMGGQKRYARYASTQSAADRASLVARG